MSQASQLLKDNNVSEYLNQRKSEIVSDLQQEFMFDALVARIQQVSVQRCHRSTIHTF